MSGGYSQCQLLTETMVEGSPTVAQGTSAEVFEIALRAVSGTHSQATFVVRFLGAFFAPELFAAGVFFAVGVALPMAKLF